MASEPLFNTNRNKRSHIICSKSKITMDLVCAFDLSILYCMMDFKKVLSAKSVTLLAHRGWCISPPQRRDKVSSSTMPKLTNVNICVLIVHTKLHKYSNWINVVIFNDWCVDVQPKNACKCTRRMIDLVMHIDKWFYDNLFFNIS